MEGGDLDETAIIDNPQAVANYASTVLTAYNLFRQGEKSLAIVVNNMNALRGFSVIDNNELNTPLKQRKALTEAINERAGSKAFLITNNQGVIDATLSQSAIGDYLVDLHNFGSGVSYRCTGDEKINEKFTRRASAMDFITEQEQTLPPERFERKLKSYTPEHTPEAERIFDSQMDAVGKHAEGFRSGVASPAGHGVADPSSYTPEQWRALLDFGIAALRMNARPAPKPVYSPDGARIIVPLSADTLAVWDAERGQPVRALTGAGEMMLVYGFSPDGRRVVAGTGGGRLWIWDIRSGTKVHNLSGHTEFVREVGYLADGLWLISGSADRTVRLWDAASGSEVATFPSAAGITALRPAANLILGQRSVRWSFQARTMGMAVSSICKPFQ